MRRRVVCKEYYTLNTLCMHPIQVHTSVLFKISGKIPHRYWWNKISSEFYIFSTVARNFPSAHTKDYSEGPLRDICRVDRKVSVIERRGQLWVTQKPRRAGRQTARWAGGLARGSLLRHPARGSSAGQPLAGSHSPLSSEATAAADLQSSKTPSAR